MRLLVSTPLEILLDETDVAEVLAPGRHGRFGMLPGHVDFVALLVPGLVAWDPPSGKRRYLAVDGGVLVKREDETSISTRQGVVGPELSELERLVETSFRERTERERRARKAMARLEADIMRHLTEGGQRGTL